MALEIVTNGIKTVDGIFEKYQDVCDGFAKEIKKNTVLYSAAGVKDHIESLQDEERLLKVGIIGRVKAGKSSLINALLFDGADVLPKAATPMTAALTMIEYGEDFSAEVDFFNAEDIDKLQKNSQRYQQRIIEESEQIKVDEMQRQSARNPGMPVTPPDAGYLKKKAERLVSDLEPTLKAAFELYEKVKTSTIKIQDLPAKKTLQALSAEELNKELHRYVGSSGEFMPFTNVLRVFLPYESLKGLTVIDTPGLNDAVASREQRTYNNLKECNVVYVVSPAGQFLNAQDLELADRLTKRDGIQEIYVVASQVDTQLHGSERQKHQGNLPNVLDGLRGTLAASAAATLANQNNPVLKGLDFRENERLFITSGLCQTLLTQPASSWDENAKHTHDLLKRSYPEYFLADTGQEYLGQLAGTNKLLKTIAEVREKKGEIVNKQINDFLAVQNTSLHEGVGNLITHFQERAETVKESSIDKIQKNLTEVEQLRVKGEVLVNNIYIEEVQLLSLDISQKINQLIRDFRAEVRGDMDSAEGEGTETYQAEKSGLVSGLARMLWGGGYEDKTRTFNTLKAAEVRSALEDMQFFIKAGLSEVAENELIKWRKKLTVNLIQALRSEVGDEHVKAEQLMMSCRKVVGDIQNLPEPNLGSLPAELSKSGKLKGYEADEYLEEARVYLSDLVKSAQLYSQEIKKSFSSLAAIDLGNMLFEYLQQEVEQLKEQVENKTLTLDKIQMAIKELQGIS